VWLSPTFSFSFLFWPSFSIPMSGVCSQARGRCPYLQCRTQGGKREGRRKGGPRVCRRRRRCHWHRSWCLFFLSQKRTVRIYLVSWLFHQSLDSLAVREGFAMFGVDRNGKTFVAGRIVASWRRQELKAKRWGRRSSRQEFWRRARCGFPR
jgi:hypothetical protein